MPPTNADIKKLQAKLDELETSIAKTKTKLGELSDQLASHQQLLEFHRTSVHHMIVSAASSPEEKPEEAKTKKRK